MMYRMVSARIFVVGFHFIFKYNILLCERLYTIATAVVINLNINIKHEIEPCITYFVEIVTIFDIHITYGRCPMVVRVFEHPKHTWHERFFGWPPPSQIERIITFFLKKIFMKFSPKNLHRSLWSHFFLLEKLRSCIKM